MSQITCRRYSLLHRRLRTGLPYCRLLQKYTDRAMLQGEEGTPIKQDIKKGKLRFYHEVRTGHLHRLGMGRQSAAHDHAM